MDQETRSHDMLLRDMVNSTINLCKESFSLFKKLPFKIGDTLEFVEGKFIHAASGLAPIFLKVGDQSLCIADEVLKFVLHNFENYIPLGEPSVQSGKLIARLTVCLMDKLSGAIHMLTVIGLKRSVIIYLFHMEPLIKKFTRTITEVVHCNILLKPFIIPTRLGCWVIESTMERIIMQVNLHKDQLQIRCRDIDRFIPKDFQELVETPESCSAGFIEIQNQISLDPSRSQENHSPTLAEEGANVSSVEQQKCRTLMEQQHERMAPILMEQHEEGRAPIPAEQQEPSEVADTENDADQLMQNQHRELVAAPTEQQIILPPFPSQTRDIILSAPNEQEEQNQEQQHLQHEQEHEMQHDQEQQHLQHEQEHEMQHDQEHEREHEQQHEQQPSFNVEPAIPLNAEQKNENHLGVEANVATISTPSIPIEPWHSTSKLQPSLESIESTVSPRSPSFFRKLFSGFRRRTGKNSVSGSSTPSSSSSKADAEFEQFLSKINKPEDADEYLDKLWST